MPEPISKLNPQNWLSAFADELYCYAIHKTGNKDQAEDLVQDTFFAALKTIESFKGQCSERTWLYRILKNKIADHYRKASTKYEVPYLNFETDNSSYLDTYFTKEGDWKENALPKDWGIDISSGIENKELGMAIQTCVEKLPESQKHLIVLKLVEEEETETICKELKISPSNYWVMIHRAKLQLRACLERTWFNA